MIVSLAGSLAEADAEQRRLRPELDVGIGGSRDPGKLKCLHAHGAFALARPGYELGEQILAAAGERWCPDARCGQAVTGRPQPGRDRPRTSAVGDGAKRLDAERRVRCGTGSSGRSST